MNHSQDPRNLFHPSIIKALKSQGRYSQNIVKYQLVIPRKTNKDGSFLSFKLPHFFKHAPKSPAKRSAEDPYLNYGLTFDDTHHSLDLWPSHDFISPDLFFERRDPLEKVQKRDLRYRDGSMCYFYGKIKGKPDSRIAISTCDGLAGYILVNNKKYFIEPVSGHTANKHGQLLHLVYEAEEPLGSLGMDPTISPCGTNTKWEEAWRERFLNEFKKGTRFQRSSTSVYRYLETLVVADKKFLEHHKNTDIDTYILTIMNMVSDYYHDSSAGNQMDVVVVRVIYLEKEEEEIDLVINPDADKTLASFCKWQQTVNPKDAKHPNHHDIAILLTRYDICADKLSNCGLMGLAYVAAACTGDKPCAINEDGGLILGVVVAHEMGHVMGCSHDTKAESGCQPQAKDDSYYVMSPFVHLHTNVWSTCSKTFMTELFDNNLGECLNDEPQESIYKETGMLPGAMYDAQYQCNMEFPGSTVCNVAQEKFCQQLLCKTSPTSCMTNGEPPADGTKCAENMWCYDTKCIEIGERPQAVNGGWGKWGEWSRCSRTCGGGVSYSERHCDNPVPKHKGRYCLGERKKVKICNTLACPSTATAFRALQCSEYDKKPFQQKLYKWQPFMKEDDPCGLYCINEDRVYSKMAPRAKDGTKCKRGTANMCIGGVCTKVGCDHVLNSDAVVDDCGICKGDGTQCKIIDETYKAAPGHGYVKIATIPKGSRNVLVQELAPSDNTIAVSAGDEKKFYLNGQYVEQQDGDHDIGGVEGVYSHPEPNKENLMIYGPLKEDIVLFVVYYKKENVGYRYKYAEPGKQMHYQPHYHWEFVEWNECSARCGGGTEISEPECIEEKAGKVSPNFCKATEKPPPKSRKCNEDPCKTRWRVGKWGPCTACKFQSGVRRRDVECVREAAKPGAEDVLIEDNQCSAPQPGTRELCNAHKTCRTIKRDVDDFPCDRMQHLWFQTREEYGLQKPLSFRELTSDPGLVRAARRNVIKARLRRDSAKCDQGADKGGKKGKPALKVGTIVADKIPSKEIKLIEVPLKQSHLSSNLTDAAFETMGDKIPDKVDTCHEKVYTGAKAAEMLKKMQHVNMSHTV